MSKKQEYFYITTPIYYVNDKPHIGHTYTNIIASVINNYKKSQGVESFFLSGTDEHGLKIESSARKAGLEPQEFVDKICKAFEDLLKITNSGNDDFIRTTSQRHKDFVIYFWKELEKNGYIYLAKYSGYYSIRDEAFYKEEELIDGKAPTGADVEWVEEDSYFFRLSAFGDKLLKFYKENPDFIKPRSRYNEVINFVKSGLRDLSISRTSFNWGIKAPSDEKHVIYVWLDALVNYLSGIDYYTDNPSKKEKANLLWNNVLHIVGKDIIKFHGIYWPAFLMANNIALPKRIIAHGWWTNNGEKISKSLGNVIDPFPLIEEFGADAIRYFLIREIKIGRDGDFSKARLIERNNTELANKIGNLVQRILSFAYKNTNQSIPSINITIDEIYENSEILTGILEKNIPNIDNHINKFEINEILDIILNIVDEANIYIDQKAPWKLKDNKDKMNIILYTSIEIIRYIAILISPIIPVSANKILDQINVPQHNRKLQNCTMEFHVKPEIKINKPEIIFKNMIISKKLNLKLNSEKEILVSLDNVSKKINENVILENISFDLHSNEIVTLIGQNGAGKTTIAKIIIGLTSYKGIVNKKNKLKISYMPQIIDFNFSISLKSGYFLELISEKKIKEIVKIEKYKQLLDFCDFEKNKDKLINELSNGQKQKFVLIANLIRDTDLLILDEPTSALDLSSRNKLNHILSEYKQYMSILMISHDLYAVMKHSDYVICVNKHICCIGKPTENEGKLLLEKTIKDFGFYLHDHDHTH